MGGGNRDRLAMTRDRFFILSRGTDVPSVLMAARPNHGSVSCGIGVSPTFCCSSARCRCHEFGGGGSRTLVP